MSDQAAQISAIIEELLKNRQLSDPAERARFLQPNYTRDLHDPFLLPDMAGAVERIKQAIARQEQITIYGDYDIDGLTATAVLKDALARLGAQTVTTFIPDRFVEGYGLNPAALQRIIASGTSLIITVDCGTTAVEPIADVAKKVDIIVTDHHEPGAELPTAATAVINPKRSDSEYPFRELAGVGVAFKLVQALQQALPGLEAGQEKWLLDLVALGTVCDVVPLVDENRALVYWGLEVFQQTKRPGLLALSQVTGRSLASIDTMTFGFVFGPRLNAAGRLEHATQSLDLLTGTDFDRALQFAQTLDSLNQQRRTEQDRIERAAHDRLASYDDPVIVLADEGWSHGIVGIVASRLVERYQKPVFLLQIQGRTTKGSARSFGDFNLASALNQVRPLLIRGGGHHMAAGVSLRTDKINDFSIAINDYYRSLKLEDQDRYAQQSAEIVLPNSGLVSLELIDSIDQLAPFGAGNQLPLFGLEGTVAEARRVGTDQNHLKLQIQDSYGTVDGIFFRAESTPTPKLRQRVSVVAELSRNEFNGRVTAQLLIRQLKAIPTS
jgi:single-stranded-DNA-specific exonuclease